MNAFDREAFSRQLKADLAARVPLEQAHQRALEAGHGEQPAHPMLPRPRYFRAKPCDYCGGQELERHHARCYGCGAPAPRAASVTDHSAAPTPLSFGVLYGHAVLRPDIAVRFSDG